jgi:hypothetical protein
MAGILAFAEIACVAVESGEWRVELALYGLDEFLHTLCVVDPARGRGGVVDRFSGPIQREITTSEEWLAVVERLAAAAAEQGSRARPSVQKPEGLSHSEGYTSVTKPGGQHFTLTKEQGRVIERFDKAWMSGNPDLSASSILSMLERETSRLQDIFRSSPGAWKALIKRTRKGVYRLNLPDPPVSHI